MSPRSIGVVTVARSDYGIYRSVLRAIQDDPSLRLRLMVTGMHLSPHHGASVGLIEEDGIPIADRIPMLLASDMPEGISTSIGLGIQGFAAAFARQRPDVLVVLGDRFEMFAAAAAALPFKIPVAHIHGGELTAGAIDDAMRHAITKLSHLHFVSTEDSRRRVLQLGEAPERVVVSGAPALDSLTDFQPLTASDLAQRYGLRSDPPPLLVTYHPVTLEYERAHAAVTELLAALDAAEMPVVFTAPNADTASGPVRAAIVAWVRAHPGSLLVENLGTRAYFSLMGVAAAMVGNSSSGLLEAPSFGLPVVNIGRRQEGRVRAANVLDAPEERKAIEAAIAQAISPSFRARLRGLQNPYGDGRAAGRIVRMLRDVPLGDDLVIKKFCDAPHRP